MNREQAVARMRKLFPALEAADEEIVEAVEDAVKGLLQEGLDKLTRDMEDNVLLWAADTLMGEDDDD